jgi:hypothetical protein
MTEALSAHFIVLLTIVLVFSPGFYAFPNSHLFKNRSAELFPVASLPGKITSIGPANSTVPQANYDEQLGLTLTQNFTSLSYNVTAVDQRDLYGYGPAYLLNGLSNVGYWYQVGLSWDWPIDTGGYSSGFSFNYEVFSPNATSIFPQDAGGLANFTGPVDPGDVVGLSMTFEGSYVSMQAYDWNTHSIASVSFQSYGADTFIGLPSSISNSKGFFTGLMTEQYQVNVYNGSEAKVTFSTDLNISSAWMWVDEFNANTSDLIFFQSTPSPISYLSSPEKLQYFFFEGATLISNAYEFITGSSGTVLLTVSYSNVGGAPAIAPTFVYSSNGTLDSTQLGTDPQTYIVDNGSTWSVSATLPGVNSSMERWTTSNTTTGNAFADETIRIVYYHQFLMYFSYSVFGGGSNYGSPDLTFVNYGRPNSLLLAQAPFEIWADAGTPWNATGLLPGSNGFQRWVGNGTAGVFGSQANVTLSYFHESLIAVGYSIIGGGTGYQPPQFQSVSLNETLKRVLSPTPAPLWLDDGAQWRVTTYLNGSTGAERWITQEYSGRVNETVISPVYYHQSLVSLTYSVLGNDSGFRQPVVNWSSFGMNMSTALNSSTSPSVWMDFGTAYSYPPLVPGGPSERWVADPLPNGTVSSQSEIKVSYQTQFFVTISQPRYGGGVIRSVPSGWYNASQDILLASSSYPGWKLWSWTGTGEGAFVGNSTDALVNVNSPITESVIFYPSVTIGSGVGGSVSYNIDGTVGKIKSEQNITFYVPPLSEISLSARPSSALNLFTNWKGWTSSGSESILMQARAPETIGANFGFNYPLIFLSFLVLFATITLAGASLFRRRK